MGDYINPKNESKEDFLDREANEISREEFLALPFHKMKKKVAVCLADNGYFSTFQVRNRRDAAYYADELDVRPKRYFVLDRKTSTLKMSAVMAHMMIDRRFNALRERVIEMFAWK